MIDYFWIKICCPIWSFIVNSFYWLFNINKIGKVKVEKKLLKESIETVEDIKQVLNKFKWTEDKLKDWRPWIITLINRKYKDDCDGAAELSRFLFKQINIKGYILSLCGKTGHAIFISADKKYLASNNNVIEGDWTDSNILKHFGGKYTKIIKR